MEDRFKFRVFVTENDAYPEKVGYVNPECFCICNGGVSFFDAEYDFAEGVFIEQCTGLINKNGILIYENDVVKHNVHIGVIIYSKENACWCINFVKGYSVYSNRIIQYAGGITPYEIIGNVHENRDLIEDACL